MRSAPTSSLPDRVRAQRLPGVAHQPQSSLSRVGEHGGEIPRRTVGLIPAEAEGHDAVLDPVRRHLGHLSRLFHAPLPDGVPDPVDLDRTRSGRLADGIVNSRGSCPFHNTTPAERVISA